MSELKFVGGKFFVEGFHCCLHDIQKKNWHHVVTLLHSCVVFDLTFFFSYFQLDCAICVEHLDGSLHFRRDSIFGEDLEKKSVINGVKGFD